MSSKKKTTKKVHSTPASKKPEKHTTYARGLGQKNLKVPVWIIPAILLVTAIVYAQNLGAGFVNLDDDEYVRNNYLLKSLSNLKLLLTTPVQGNYHPLTMLSLAINYQISGLNAWSYHLFNFVFHLINCYLVFRLAFLLSNRNVIISFVTALLFGIHPMHVESVAWVSERKDVLYSLFFLVGLISFTKYIDTGSRNQYLFSILFLLLSILSKPAAVIFPVALFSIDLLRKRKLTLKLFIEKIPFFALALAGGILTIVGQKAAGATGTANFSLLRKALFGFYGIMMYIVKMIAPFNLAVFYRYPAANENLSFEYYIAPLFFVLLIGIVYYSLKRDRVFAFGIVFYVINLLLVLQFLPVGSAVIAERYTYIPYIGLFFIVGWLIAKYANNSIQKSLTIIVPVAVLFAVLTWKQVSMWQTSAKLWDDAIKNQPSYKAYANRALIYREEQNFDRAIEYYNEAIRLNIMDYEGYANRGNVYFYLNKPEQAFNDYRRALSLKPDYYPALDNMGAEFAMQGKYDSALKYSSQAILVKPDYKPAYSNRALTYMKLNRNEEAIKDWQKFLEYEPEAADVYNTIGTCYQAMGKYQESLIPINKAIQMNPVADFYLNRSYSYNGLKNTEAAKQDALKAKQLGLQIPADYAKSLGIQ